MDDRYRAHPARSPAAPEPFWQRLRTIAFYPLRGPALYSMIALTLCSLLTIVPVVGWIVGILTWLAAYKYSFDILRHTADGHMDSPEHALGTGDGTVLRLLALIILLAVAVVLVTVFAGPVAGLLALLLVVFLQPGCVISLAMDGSLRQAANPATSLTLALRIGWPYLAAFGLLFVIQASALTASRWVHQFLPPFVGDLAVTMVTLWGLFAAFHLMGYLVYQYHEELGYEPGSHYERLPERHDPDQRLLDEAGHFVREGQADTALEILRAEVRSRLVGLPVLELYQRLLRNGGRKAELHEHTRQYIARLLAEKQGQRALGLLREALDADSAFVPLLPEQGEELAERARLAGQFQLTTDTLRAMIQAWPKSPAAAKWSLDAALLLAERFGRDDEARQLLEQALARCEDEEQRGKLETALKALAVAPM
ncbi:tetratricopeptide repeat protein [Pseudoxanthomonas wuyuanensis]